MTTEPARFRHARGALPAALAAALLCAGSTGCNSKTCGPGTAPAAGVTATAAGTVVTYGQFTSSANNDCPSSTPNAPTSITVTGLQVDPAPAMPTSIVLCLPQPDQIGTDPIDLTDDTMVRVINVNAYINGCMLDLDRTVPFSGTVQFSGFCGNGTDSAGYALTLSGGAGGELVCPTDAGQPMVTKQMIKLSGTAAVMPVGQAATQQPSP